MLVELQPPKTIALVRQQPALDIDRVAFGHAHESAQGSLTPDDAMTRNDQRDGIRATRAADRPRRASELARDFAVGARLADRYRRKRIPHAAPEHGARGRERKGETELRIIEKALDLPA